jgi:transposase InsO family protein
VSVFVELHRHLGVEPVCQALGVSASAYYQRASGERSSREVEDERLIERIRDVHRRNYECYGQERVWRALGREGEEVGRDRVARLMRREGIRGAKRRGRPWKTTASDPAAEQRPDLVCRDFTAERPNELWVADLTQVRCWEIRLYLAFVIDVFSRMVVGWQLAAHTRTDMVLDALKMAIAVRGPGAAVGVVHHSDHGSQFVSLAYTQTLDDHGVRQSLGSVGDALDNALAESWVDSLKTELIADRVWRTRGQLELAIVEYIGWFNHVRLHSSLGYTPPTEFEQRHLEQLQLPLTGPIPDNGSVADASPSAANGLRTRRVSTTGADFAADRLILTQAAPARTARTLIPGPDAAAGLSALRFENPRSNTT